MFEKGKRYMTNNAVEQNAPKICSNQSRLSPCLTDSLYGLYTSLCLIRAERSLIKFTFDRYLVLIMVGHIFFRSLGHIVAA